MTVRDPIRAEMLTFRPNAIAEVSRAGIGDPGIIPLWFGETDLVTPTFIRDAAKQALDEGRTFYTFPGGHPALRAALHASPRVRLSGLAVSAGGQARSE